MLGRGRSRSGWNTSPQSVTASGVAALLHQTEAERRELLPCRRERPGEQVERRWGRQGQVAALGLPDQPQAVPGRGPACVGQAQALQEWLGHSNIQNTVRYAELTAKRLEDASQQEN